MQTVPVPIRPRTESLTASSSMQPRLLCSKCGLYGFTSLNDLETHIVKKHFRVNALFKCCFTKCVTRFATDVDRLEHLNTKQHDTRLKKLIEMEDEHFVWLRLAISDIVNESIKMSLLRLIEPDGNNFQAPRKSQGPDMKRKMSNIIQSEFSRRDGMETSARQRSAQPPLERRPQRQQNLTKPRTSSKPAINLDRLYQPEGVTCSMAANSSISKPRMEISEPNIENNIRIESESSSRSCLVKVGQRLINVLVTPSDVANSNNESIDKGNKRPDHETSSRSSVIKDERSLFDELAETVSVSSDHSDYLSIGNSESTAPRSGPEKQRMEKLSDRNKEHQRTEHENSVVKDEPSLSEELASTFHASSDHGDYIILSNIEPAARHRPEKQRMKTLSDRNSEHKRAERGNCVVKEEPILIDDFVEKIPAPSNHRETSKQRVNSGGVNSTRYSENLSSERTEHENSVIKDEPSLIDELTATIPAPSNHSFTPSDNEITVLSSKPKRSRKQNFSDVNDNDGKRTQISSNPSVVKDEPSLIDDLASMIPGPSNHGNDLETSNNVPNTDSDDEIRSVMIVPPVSKRTPNSGIKSGTKCLTVAQMKAIVRANEQGTKRNDIAKIFDTSRSTVYKILARYRTEGAAFLVVPNRERPSKARARKEAKTGKGKWLSTLEKEAIVSAHEQGMKRSDIARIFEASMSTVKRVLHAYRTTGSITGQNLPNPKRSRKQNLYEVDGDDDRGSLMVQEDDLKIILPKERKQRKDWKHTTTSVRRAVVNAGNEGLPQQKIARIFDISAKTVGGILKRWKTDGTIERKPTVGRERKVNKVVEQFVLNIVKDDPFKSATEIKSEILKKFNLTISHHTTCRILSRYNSLKRTTQKDLSQSKPS